jgi:hypothetical protein
MKTLYRGYEISVRRERSMGGDDLLYYSIFRMRDGYECTSGFTTDSSSAPEYTAHMKDRIDAELSEADPWGERAAGLSGPDSCEGEGRKGMNADGVKGLDRG